MTLGPKQIFYEWGFLALLGALCAVLTVLQYRWTGEVAEAEMTRLRADLNDQARDFCHAFDVELAAGCTQLLPDAGELQQRGRDDAHLDHLHKWLAGNPRPIFKSIAVAVPMRDDLQLFVLDQKNERFVQKDWPTEWAALRDNLARKGMRGGSPPFNDPTGSLFELPVFGGNPESEWLILQLDLDYARNTWLPELARKFLNPGGAVLNNVAVKSATPPGAPIYSSAENTNNKGRAEVSIRFNRQGHSTGNSRGPVPDGRWMLEAWHRPGALEAIVSVSRRRDLAVAAAVNALILLAGVLLVRQARRSRQLAETQIQFVASVSHELRTPLTVIRGAGHNLLRGIAREPGQIEQYSRLIIEHTDHLAQMVEQLLELADARKDQSTALRQPVALGEILHEAIAAAGHDTKSACCEVQCNLPANLPDVMGDALALRRVFQNLISNAAKHGGQGGWIGVTAATGENGKTPMVEVQIADHGPGVPENELTEIFKPFFRGLTARTRQIRGSGLGLSLVREIVEAHGGAISVRSQCGAGAIFTVQLPLAGRAG